MRAETVRLKTTRINKALETAGELLSQIRGSKDYKLLDYDTFGEYLEGEISASSSTVYRMLNTHHMNRVINSRSRELLNQSEAQVLKRLEVEEALIVPIVVAADKRAQSEGRKRCTRDIKAMGVVVKQLYDTGTVDIGDGTMHAVEAALTQEEHEIGMRQKQHIADNYSEPEPVKPWSTIDTVDCAGEVRVVLPDRFIGKAVEIIVKVVGNGTN